MTDKVKRYLKFLEQYQSFPEKDRGMLTEANAAEEELETVWHEMSEDEHNLIRQNLGKRTLEFND
jgi:hypothetical protein